MGAGWSWRPDAHGWDIVGYLKSGRLVRVLPQYETPDADSYAVYPQRHRMAARGRGFEDFVTDAFRTLNPAATAPSAPV